MKMKTSTTHTTELLVRPGPSIVDVPEWEAPKQDSLRQHPTRHRMGHENMINAIRWSWFTATWEKSAWREKRYVPYVSGHRNRCGHDGHSTSATAYFTNWLRDQVTRTWHGDV